MTLDDTHCVPLEGLRGLAGITTSGELLKLSRQVLTEELGIQVEYICERSTGAPHFIEAVRSIFGWFLLNMIDYQHGQWTFLLLQSQPELLVDGVEEGDGAVRV